VSDGVSPQLPNVMLLGLTVATAGALDEVDTTRVSAAWKLHPFSTSLRGWTKRPTVPFAPPAVSEMLSAVASMLESRLFEMSSANAIAATARAAAHESV